jgi:two-component system, response regulator
LVREEVILLVEDDPDDELLTRRALKKNNLCNELVVARDGEQALDYLFGTGSYKGRDTSVMPQVILLDLGLPKVDGLEVLECVRSDERTSRLPVVVLTSSRRSRTVWRATSVGRTASCASRWTLLSSTRRCRSWGCIGWY